MKRFQLQLPVLQPSFFIEVKPSFKEVIENMDKAQKQRPESSRAPSSGGSASQGAASPVVIDGRGLRNVFRSVARFGVAK